MKAWLIKQGLKFGKKHWKKILIASLAIPCLVVALQVMFFNSIIGTVLAPFAIFGGGDGTDTETLGHKYVTVGESSGVDWPDMAAYDAMRTGNTFEDVDEDSIKETSEKFIFYTKVCETTTSTDSSSDTAGNVWQGGSTNLNSDTNSGSKTTTSTTCRDVKNFYTLEEVLKKEGYTDQEIEYALYIQQNLSEMLGEDSTPDGDDTPDDPDAPNIDPDIIANNKFIWPVPDINRITSNYGYRIHPVLHTKKLHMGVDLSNAKIGDPIIASRDGYVYQQRGAADGNACGNWIKLKHDDGYTSRYCHMNKVAIKATTNGEATKVKAGDVIGYVGKTGRVTGPHLHFEITVNGKIVDPLPYIIKTRPGG